MKIPGWVDGVRDLAVGACWAVAWFVFMFGLALVIGVAHGDLVPAPAKAGGEAPAVPLLAPGVVVTCTKWASAPGACAEWTVRNPAP